MLSTLNMFLSTGVFTEATIQRNSEKKTYIDVQEFSRKYKTKFLDSKRVGCSVYSKSLKENLVNILLFRGGPSQTLAK